MKKVISLLGLLCACTYALAQDDFFNPESTILDVPKSPEVAAFEKFSTEVNMYTGTPSIAIPLYTFQGKESSVPLSISYDASGIKVEQLATHIGLGWNLNFGGIISRTVNVHPDDYTAGSTPGSPNYKITNTTTQGWMSTLVTTGKIHGLHNTQSQVLAAMNFYREYAHNNIDYQPDTFSVNVNGLSGTIFIDYTDTTGPGDYKAYFLEDPYVKVVYDTGNDPYNGLDGFTITDTNGMVYKFQEFEITRQLLSPTGQTSGGYQANYVSAWYLTEMISSNGLDTFTFEYDIDIWPQNLEQAPIQTRKLVYQSGGCNYHYLGGAKDVGKSEYKKDQVRLDNIYYTAKGQAQKLILSVTPGTRQDLDGVQRITDLTVYDMIRPSSNGNEILRVKFNNNTYFGDTGSSHEYDKRLKLDGIQIYKDNINDAKEYLFEYNSPAAVPPRFQNYAQDYWGYYNGATGNADLAARPSLSYNTGIANFWTELETFNQGADRRPNFANTEIGTLTSIRYPTGGKATYHYEPHLDSFGLKVGGLRIRSVESSTEGTQGDSYETFYYYGDLKLDFNAPINSIPTIYNSSGIAQQEIMFSTSELVDVDEGAPPIACRANDLLLTKNKAVLVPNPITYSVVSQIQFKNGAFNGTTVTKFFNARYDYGFGEAAASQPFQLKKLHYGSVEKQQVYDKNLTLLQETINTITTIDLASSLPTTPPLNVGLIIKLGGSPNGTVAGGKPCESENPTSYPYRWEFTHSTTSGIQTNCPAGFDEVIPSETYYHIYNIYPYTYTQHWVKKTKTISKTIEYNKDFETITDYTYGSNEHNLPTLVETSDSKGGIHQLETLYSGDYNNLPAGYPNTAILQQFVTNKNMRGVPAVQIKSYAETQGGAFETLSTQWQEFKDIDPAQGPDNQVIKPSVVYASKGTDPPEARLVYTIYDSYGNLVEARYPYSNTFNCFVWGYQGQYLLAEVKNISYNVLENNAGVNSLIAISDNPNSTEAQVANALTSFRNTLDSNYSEFLMTGFVYEPGIGVKLISDERGFTTHFTYDQHRRLQQVKDGNGHLLSENVYNLREN